MKRKCSGFTLVMQGLLTNESIKVINYAVAIVQEVIVVAWATQEAKEVREKLNNTHAKIFLLEDPGSLRTYVESGIIKYLNVTRRKEGFLYGLKKSNSDIAIVTRLDLFFDYENFFLIWRNSGKRFGSTNVTSVCPNRLLGDGFYFCVSDWAYVGYTNELVKGLALVPSESSLVCDPYTLNGRVWYTTLCPEQIFALSLSGEQTENVPKNFELRNTSVKYLFASFHKKTLDNFINICRDDIKLESIKYGTGKSTRWQTYELQDFSDNGLLKRKPYQFILFLAGKIYRHLLQIKTISVANKID